MRFFSQLNKAGRGRKLFLFFLMAGLVPGAFVFLRPKADSGSSEIAGMKNDLPTGLSDFLNLQIRVSKSYYGKSAEISLLPSSDLDKETKAIVTEPQETPAKSKIDKPRVSDNEETKDIGAPKRLIIPALQVDAAVRAVGLGVSGEMEAPKNPRETGWFELGPRPGEKGSSVIAGHLNNESGQPAVFWHLDDLKAGDLVYIVDDKGRKITFKVIRSVIYDEENAPLASIFAANDGSYLNLITCDGVWVEEKNNYSKRLVVFTEKV